MELFLISFAVLALATAGMGVGALGGRPPLRACGDAGLLGDADAECPACADPCAWRRWHAGDANGGSP